MLEFNKYSFLTLIHEEGHAKAVIDILSQHKNDTQYQPELSPIILIGDYKSANAIPFSFDVSCNCQAYIIYFPALNGKSKRGLTLHPCMDIFTDDEIKLCAKAGLDAELTYSKNIFTTLISRTEYIISTDKDYYKNPDKFRTIKPCGYPSFADAYQHFYSLYNRMSPLLCQIQEY